MNKVHSKVEEILNRKWTLFDNNNLQGNFINQNTFEIRMKGLRAHTALQAEIIESQNGLTEIRLKARIIKEIYIWFFLSFAISIVFLIQFSLTGSIQFLFWSIVFPTLGPLLCIGISKVRIEALKENYVKYIDKDIRILN